MKALILFLFISTIGFGQTQTQIEQIEIISKRFVTKTSDGVEFKWELTGTRQAVETCYKKMYLATSRYEFAKLDTNLLIVLSNYMTDIYDIRFLGYVK
jgi:hypothetical protein